MEKGLDAFGTDFYANHQGDIEQYVQEVFLDDPAQIKRMDHLARMVPESASSLLDVGAGCGIFLDRLRGVRDLTAEGVELTEDLISWGLKRGHKLSVASADRLPYEDRSFDIIVSSEVIEHLPWGVYERTLQELPRVAKDWILISVPYDERRNFARCPYCGCTVNPCYHLRSFAPDDLNGLFCGFRLHTTDTIEQISVITTLKSYFPAPWHSQLVCTSCGYRTQSQDSRSRDRRISKVKEWIRAIPLPKRPRWLVGLYKRE